MDVRVLGPVEIHSPGRVWPVGPPQQRLVLAALALEANRSVTIEALIDRVWDEAPDGARRTLHVVLTRIRRLLSEISAAGEGTVELVRRSGGYALLVEPDQVDVHRMLRAVEAARRQDCPTPTRVQLLRTALGEWRGEPLAGLPGQWAAWTRQALRQRHTDTVVGWADAELAAGNPAAVLGPAGELAVEYPLLEPLAAVRMRALAATGRTTDALDEYARISAQLAEDLGAQPGPELQSVRLAVLRGQANPTAVVPQGVPPVARHTLPAEPAAFVGRSSELEKILAATQEAGPSVFVIDGMPGVGKTALAVHIGHQLGGRFADRRLFVDLYAHTAGRSPARPADVLADLLTADGVDPRFLPPDVDGRSALWRARTADRHVLLILDNAVDSEQVRPLLPGASECLVLITSRRRLADLDARAVALDTLAPGEAEEMFIRLAPRATGADPAELRELVALCGRLPLAIALTAGLFAKRTAWSVRNLIAEITPNPLTAKAETRTVAAAFDLSYRSLSAGRQRFLRRLATHPGAEFDRFAAAALTGVDLDTAVDHLDALLDDHLLEETSYRRFHMHDLIREYARRLAAGDPGAENDHAMQRLFGFYGYIANHADARLARYSRSEDPLLAVPAAAVPDIGDRDQALAWLRTERTNVLACIAHAAGHGQDRWVSCLTATMASLLFLDGPWDLALKLHAAAAAAANRVGDNAGLAAALTALGDVEALTGDYTGSKKRLSQAISVCRALGDRRGEAAALVHLGGVGYLTDDPSTTQILAGALRLYRDLDDRRGQAAALLALGIAYRLADANDAASHHLSEALAAFEEVDDPLGQADAMTNRGALRREVGDYRGATDDLQQALAIYRRHGHRLGQANALVSLGLVRKAIGDFDGATGDLNRALAACRRLGHRFGLANALMSLGIVLRDTGRYAESLENLQQALSLYQELDNRLHQGYARMNLGGLLRLTGDHDAAERALGQALDTFRELDVPAGEAEALNHRGAARRSCGRTEQALADHRRALQLARSAGNTLEQARALEGIGHCTTDPAARMDELRAALAIYERLGVPDFARLADFLAEQA